MNRTLRLLFSFLLLSLVGIQTAHAAGAAEAKARLRERVPQVDALKTKGAVGENNRGFLEVRDGGADVAALVQAQNRDRAEVFAETAQHTGGTAEAVGRSFAKQIAAASKPGVWLQRDDGGWYQK